MVGRKLGKYHILSRLGRGGMGVVYEAEDTYLKRRVAIKVLAPEIARDRPAVQRFLEEARSTARLNHPNIVAIYEVDQRDGLVFLVMELVRGQNAQERINSGSPVDWATATTITAQVCHALEAAHAAGLIHRDIKPSNILLARRPAAKRRGANREGADGGATVFGGADQTGLGMRPTNTDKSNLQPADATDELVVKLVDFGLAKSVDPGRNPLTSANTLLGTPSYMSPEQCSSEPLDARSDVYSLGATYFALLTGRPPYVADAPMKVMFQHCSGSVPDPQSLNPIVPSVCGELIRRAMAREPSARFTSAHEMAEAFETALSQTGGAQGAAAVFGARPLRDEDASASGREVDAHATPPYGAAANDPTPTAAGGLTLARPRKGRAAGADALARSRRKWLLGGAGAVAAAAVGIPLASALFRDRESDPPGGGGVGGGGAGDGGASGGKRTAR
ncbi:MAG TPA: serine/threonine-protein kinase, partial [Pirellulaceae bacterium]|nr:serine/threonine-protein kinase [Pirellulaceae bacterium]